MMELLSISRLSSCRQAMFYELLDFEDETCLRFTTSDEIRKVKAVSPSPLYDGTYHPSLFRQPSLLLSVKT